MITTLVRISWTNLKRDRVAQALTFLLPILFFSIFASVFGNQSNSTSKIRVAVVDEDGSDLSRRIVDGLKAEAALRVRTAADPEGKGVPLDRAAAERLVQNGDVPVAIILPEGLGATAAAFGQAQGAPHIQLLADVSDPIAPQMVGGLLQKVSMTSAPDLMMKGGITQFEKYAGTLTPEQRTAVSAWLPRLTPGGSGGATNPAGGGFGIGIDTVDVMRPGASNKDSLVSFYAAGVGVMFLLFSVSGASGTLLDEVDSGTLDRVLSTRVGMSGLLAGKWLFITLVGFSQLTVMFLWGRLAFGLDLFHHLPGFVVMTAFTAAAAAGFGLMLATIARTRAQLGGMSTIIILTMSSLGGSMFPRFLMSETMQKFGLLTFNAWALDGYLKVFWRNAAVWQLWPQVLVLAVLAVVFLGLARTFARRWETA
ncbi:MAG TPA: ABC transporter permease [Vicinamibacterales bacterium]